MNADDRKRRQLSTELALENGECQGSDHMEEEEEGEIMSDGYDANEQQQQGLDASASMSGGGTADHQTTSGAPFNVLHLLNLVHLSRSSTF